jgi:drug/metabolite transporter (DMT)-like permease
LIGDAFALVSALLFAMASIAIAKAAAHNRSADNGVLLSIIMTGVLSAAALLLEWKLPAAGNGASMLGAMGWFAASGILAIVWGRLTMFKAVALAGVIRATTIRRLTPFFSVLLAWALLGETISGFGLLGMALMAASFSLLYFDNRQKLASQDLFPGPNLRRGYLFGLICALLYAVSYVVRKRGLDGVHDPYFGALIGSVAALGYYAVGCLFSAKLRADVGLLMVRPDPWQLAAAVLLAVGQISQFIAFNNADVGRVTLINSMEIFLSSYLAVMVFKTENWPSLVVAGATIVATAGVVFVALG